MNYYEHTIITRQDLSENQTKQLLTKYTEIIKKNSGKVIKTEEWGLRNLTRVIRNNRKGFYFHIKFEGEGAIVRELEKIENIDDMLIRYLTVRVKKHDLETNYFSKS